MGSGGKVESIARHNFLGGDPEKCPEKYIG